MSGLPSKRDAILLVDAYAVTTRLIALQQLQAIPSRNHEIVEADSGVEQLQFPLNDAPDVAGNWSSGTRVSLAKQISRRLVAK